MTLTPPRGLTGRQYDRWLLLANTYANARRRADQLHVKMLNCLAEAERAASDYSRLRSQERQRGFLKGRDTATSDIRFSESTVQGECIADNNWYMNQATMYAASVKAENERCARLLQEMSMIQMYVPSPRPRVSVE